MKLSTQFIILFNATLSVLLIIGQIAPCLSMCLEPPVPLAGSQLSPWLSPCASCWLLPVATAKLSKPSQAGHGTGQQHMEIIRHLGFVLFGWVLRWLWVMQWTVPCSTLAAPNQTEASGRHFCHSCMRWREIFHCSCSVLWVWGNSPYPSDRWKIFSSFKATVPYFIMS